MSNIITDAPAIGTTSLMPSIEVTNCALCGGTRSESFEHFSENIKLHPPLYYRICTHCGLVFMAPRLSEAQLNAFYAAEYRRLYHGDEKPVEENLQEQRQRSAHLAGIAA